MKKNIICITSILLLGACSNNKDTTLLDFFRGEKTTSNIEYVDFVADISLETPPQDYITTETVSSSGYYLAKRGDRYAKADYIITPSDYSIVATRTINKLLEDAPAIFATNKHAPLYLADMVQIDRYLPEGSYVAEKTAKDIIYGSAMFNITDSKNSAKYILQSSITNINTPEVPIIVYRAELYDNTDKLLGSWSASIRQVQNDDKSWW